MNNKIEHIAIKYLNKLYGDLEECRTDESPDRVFFVKNKEVFMEQDLESGHLFVGHYTIWFDLKETFPLYDVEIKSIITKWAKETYKLKRLTPMNFHLLRGERWKRLIN